MLQLNLSVDEVLTTTRSVRKRLDLSRPVEPQVIRECLELAVQAPTGSNRQGWQFVVVTEQEQRKAIGEAYRKGWLKYRQLMSSVQASSSVNMTPEQVETIRRVLSSSQYLAEHMHEVPVLLIPCIWGRVEGLENANQAGLWGSILPAAWSFMLAARERGLGTCWTTLHLYYEREAADALGIPYEKVTQAALIPVAYTLGGTDFKPAGRVPLDSIVHWEKW